MLQANVPLPSDLAAAAWKKRHAEVMKLMSLIAAAGDIAARGHENRISTDSL